MGYFFEISVGVPVNRGFSRSAALSYGKFV